MENKFVFPFENDQQLFHFESLRKKDPTKYKAMVRHIISINPLPSSLQKVNLHLLL